MREYDVLSLGCVVLAMVIVFVLAMAVAKLIVELAEYLSRLAT